nr:MAG TPA: hypothetical protein [Caudoviricetes sp.]
MKSKSPYGKIILTESTHDRSGMPPKLETRFVGNT